MSDGMATFLLCIYVLPAGIMFVMSTYMLDERATADRRKGARLMILAPIWPLVVIWIIPRWVRNLFDLADFGGKR